MQINLTGRHLQITDDIRSYIKKRANKIEGIFRSILDLEAVIEQKKNRYFTEMTIAARRATFHAQGETHDIFSSLDMVMDKIEVQIRRHKERVKDRRHRRSQSEVAVQLNEEGQPPVVEADRSHLSEPLPPIASVPEKFAPKPMTVEEAAMQLQTSDDSLLLFLNADTKQVNLLYETDNGEYGWVEPQFT